MKIETGKIDVVRCSFSENDWNGPILEVDVSPIDLQQTLVGVQVYRTHNNMIFDTHLDVKIRQNSIVVTKPAMIGGFNGIVSVILLSPVV